MFGEIVDSVVSVFSPVSGLQRKLARQTLANLRSYDAGKLDRTTKRWKANAEAGDSPLIGEVQCARQRAWDLYRNNCYARKACNALKAHVVGCGLKVESLAFKGRDGAAYDKFRKDAAELWEQFQATAFGVPGRGGMTFAEGCGLAFLEWLLSGECFVRLIRMDRNEQYAGGYPVPLRLELYEAERLLETDYDHRQNLADGNRIVRGIEFDAKNRRVAYHFYKHHPNDIHLYADKTDTVRIPASEILHVFLPSRPSQTRGVSHFAPAVLKLKDVADYEYNELVAASVSACVALIVKTQSGAGRIGLNAPSGSSGVDADSNAIDRVQPGMIFRLNPNEDAQGFNPSRPNTAVDSFVAHMLRGVAGSLPGLKASTVTGDYRNSSFSSERSADNDCWREIEQVQEFFMSHLCQPVWESFIDAAVEGGALAAQNYATNRSRLVRATWNGPVAKAINPVNDENAAKIAIETGTSSLQVECAGKGLNWVEVLEGQRSEMEQRIKLGLPLPPHLAGAETQNTDVSSGGKDAAVSSDAEDELDAQDAGDKAYSILSFEGALN